MVGNWHVIRDKIWRCLKKAKMCIKVGKNSYFVIYLVKYRNKLRLKLCQAQVQLNLSFQSLVKVK